ncbi:hypothetical protein V1505DRAFT_388660 [Lipomyces doorenjongii]
MEPKTGCVEAADDPYFEGQMFFKFLEGSPAKEGKSPQEHQKDEQEEMEASATMGILSIKVQAQIPGDSPTPKEIWDRLLNKTLYRNDYPIASKRGMRKVMRTILEERGVWIVNLTLLNCKNTLQQIDPTISPACCAQSTLPAT